MSDDVTGARYLAEALKQVGVTDVFFIDAVLRRTLIELEQVGIGRVLAHSEKSAVYMADGYARVTGRVGVCMAQSVGAAPWPPPCRTPSCTGPRSWRSPAASRRPSATATRIRRSTTRPSTHRITKLHGDVAVVEELPLCWLRRCAPRSAARRDRSIST